MEWPVRLAPQPAVSDEHDLAQLLGYVDRRADQRKKLRRRRIPGSEYSFGAKFRALRRATALCGELDLCALVPDWREVRRSGSRGEGNGGRCVALGAMRGDEA